MPRVSAEYLEHRREQILNAAQRCFARKGFYETSMQDVFRESGLSAGAVYRYFKSKDQLIQAISAGVLGQMAAALEAALAEDPVPGPEQLVGRLAAAAQELSGPDVPAVGAALFALLPGFLLQHLLLEDIDAATFSRGVSELFAAGTAR